MCKSSRVNVVPVIFYAFFVSICKCATNGPCYILCVCKTVIFGTTRCQVQSYVKVYFSFGYSNSRGGVQFVIVAFVVLLTAAWSLRMMKNELACTSNIKAVI